MRIIKVLYHEDVRNLCIRHDYYTRGTCKDYENMFSMIAEDEDIDYEVLSKVATDILEHSDTDDSLDDVVSYLVYHLKCCVSVD